MTQAMAAILTAAGFTIQDANGDYRPYELRVLDGPVPGITPNWSLRDEEVAMPGQEAGYPGPAHQLTAAPRHITAHNNRVYEGYSATWSTGRTLAVTALANYRLVLQP
jgi:hypothetical protein